ncbi:hypothetical protein [Pseudodesulfovibrio cashew]|uniref:hypothetical protein n=1 Tax=Pseudodesulfovibrio cashew TaxID=2678688 RepID=UPI001F557E77|nr:hypothetical protein [Pseudodesulfovibrio cashew]
MDHLPVLSVSTLLTSGQLRADPMITGRIELEDIVDKGFLELINNKDENIKPCVRPEE